MKKVLLIVFSFVFGANLFAQNCAPTSFNLSIDNDPVRGFYTTGTGIIGNKNDMQIKLYGSMFAIGYSTSHSTKAEFGVGLNFNALDGKMTLTPQLGMTYGKAYSAINEDVLFDAVVPAFLMNYNSDAMTFDFGAKYFLALRSDDDLAPSKSSNALSIIAHPAFNITGGMKLGILFNWEYASLKTKSSSGTEVSSTTTEFMHLGPSLSFKLGGANFMISPGINLNDKINDVPDSKIHESMFMGVNFNL